MKSEIWNILSAIGQVAGVIALLIVYNRESNQSQVIERREVYQRLELSSIDLFRFEHEHVDVFRAVWFDAETAPPGSLEYLRIKQYMCQILNLFEMATSFLEEDIITAEVFASWIVWMYELAQRPAFHTAWVEDLRPNYIKSLRDLLDVAVRLADEPDGLARLYAETARIMGRPSIAAFGDELAQGASAP
jgi:hypothetical protein